MTRDDLTTIAGRSFIVTDRRGDIEQTTDRGLFVADTRFLSRYVLRLNGKAPMELESSPVGLDEAQVFATNSGLESIPNQSLTLWRRRRLGSDFREEIELANHSSAPVQLELTLAIDVDFADIFEVRTFLAGGPPERAEGQVAQERIVYSNRSPHHKRNTRISFSRRPDALASRLASFDVRLPPDGIWTLEVIVEWETPWPETALPVPVDRIRPRWEESLAGWFHEVPTLEADTPLLQRAYDRALHDLVMLELALSSGQPILAAGIPWYLAIFGRDSIISSLQTLPVAPRFAIGTLRTLAAYQATHSNAFRDSEPGKMPHEVRFGALSESDAVPHSRYYGTVDATPLWLVLFAAAHTWIGDRVLTEELLPTAKRALRWIDAYGDLDGDGFVEYKTRSPQGLVNQGWKDSWDGIRFADGRLPEPPIALVEVQGYVYAAKRAMAELYDSIGEPDEASSLRSQAARLKEQVQDAFWMPREQCYAMALDGKKRQVDGIGSNQGHLLWSGLPEPEYARTVVERLMAPDSFSRWGIRTLATSMTGYNPVGYHTGSVWPHDTTLIAAGFRRYGYRREAAMLAGGILDTTAWFEAHRLPELFCGWDREATPFPVDYPVACSPQAWAAGSAIMLITELAGVEPDGDGLRVDPIASGRHFRLCGMPYRGRRFDIEVTAGGTGSVVAHRSQRSPSSMVHTGTARSPTPSS